MAIIKIKEQDYVKLMKCKQVGYGLLLDIENSLPDSFEIVRATKTEFSFGFRFFGEEGMIQAIIPFYHYPDDCICEGRVEVFIRKREFETSTPAILYDFDENGRIWRDGNKSDVFSVVPKLVHIEIINLIFELKETWINCRI